MKYMPMVAMTLGGVGAFLGARTVMDPQWVQWVRGLLVRFFAWLRVTGCRERAQIDIGGLLHGMRALLEDFVQRCHLCSKNTRERRAVEQERSRCLNELSEFIDVVALALSAGISFDAALAMYCSRYQTSLSRLLGDAMQSWRLGLADRTVALKGVARHLQLGAFSTFVETVTESLAFGAPLAQSLSDQAEAIRQQRRYAVQERIEKAPVKMLVPTGTLILPAMLLAILGPLLASLTTTVG